MGVTDPAAAAAYKKRTKPHPIANNLSQLLPLTQQNLPNFINFYSQHFASLISLQSQENMLSDPNTSFPLPNMEQSTWPSMEVNGLRGYHSDPTSVFSSNHFGSGPFPIVASPSSQLHAQQIMLQNPSPNDPLLHIDQPMGLDDHINAALFPSHQFGSGQFQSLASSIQLQAIPNSICTGDFNAHMDQTMLSNSALPPSHGDGLQVNPTNLTAMSSSSQAQSPYWLNFPPMPNHLQQQHTENNANPTVYRSGLSELPADIDYMSELRSFYDYGNDCPSWENASAYPYYSNQVQDFHP